MKLLKFTYTGHMYISDEEAKGWPYDGETTEFLTNLVKEHVTARPLSIHLNSVEESDEPQWA